MRSLKSVKVCVCSIILICFCNRVFLHSLKQYYLKTIPHYCLFFSQLNLKINWAAKSNSLKIPLFDFWLCSWSLELLSKILSRIAD